MTIDGDKSAAQKHNRPDQLAFQSRSAKCGLLFPVGRIARFLRKAQVAPRLGAGAPVYLAAVLEYVTSEILELSGNIARDHKKRRILPRHVLLAIRNDDEINKVLSRVIIPSGGAIPNNYWAYLPSHHWAVHPRKPHMCRHRH
jgi:histone H2A